MSNINFVYIVCTIENLVYTVHLQGHIHIYLSTFLLHQEVARPRPPPRRAGRKRKDVDYDDDDPDVVLYKSGVSRLLIIFFSLKPSSSNYGENIMESMPFLMKDSVYLFFYVVLFINFFWE